MNYEIPVPLKQKHEALHDQLRQATQVGGEVGKLAETVARLMYPHFVKEDQIALPPLGLLATLAHGDATPEMAGVLALTDQLGAELPTMLAEHQAIVEALQRLRDAAQRAGRSKDRRLRAATDAACAHRGRGDVPGGDPGRQVCAAAPGPTQAGGRANMKPSQ